MTCRRSQRQTPPPTCSCVRSAACRCRWLGLSRSSMTVPSFCSRSLTTATPAPSPDPGHAKRPPPLRDGGAGAAASQGLPQCGGESTGGRGAGGCAPPASPRPPGVGLRPTLRAAAWRTLGCVILAALIVGSPRDLDQFGYVLFPSHR